MEYKELLDLISQNQFFVYIILFLGSFLDGIIFINLIIPGEIFYFFAGYFSSFGLINPYISFLVLFLAGFLGDNLSYFLGKKYFKNVFKENKRVFNLKNLNRGEKFFNKYGNKAIVLSRLLGIFSSGISSFAGVFGVKYKNFFIYNTYGLFIIICSTFLFGFVLGIGAEYFGASIIFNIVLFVISIYFILFIFKRFKEIEKPKRKRKIIYMLIKVGIIYFLLFLVLLASYFFLLYPYFSNFYSKNTLIPNIETWLKQRERKVYSDRLIKTNSNPINIVIITKKDLNSIFTKIGWQSNLSFSSGKISFQKFIDLLKKNSPPISDFYHYKYTQNYQFQDLQGGNIKREHIRFWQIGKDYSGNNIFIGSMSTDKGISLMINNGIPVIGHGIDKNIDKSRDFIKDLIIKNFQESKTKLLDFKEFKVKNYFTDGDIIIIEI